MKKKIVLWGNDEKDAKVLIALELKAKDNKVNIYTFGQEIVSEAFYNEMMDNWRTGKDVAFPEGHETEIRELSVTDDLLPETLKVQRTDLISRAKAEWHFVVLSSKLHELYDSELADLKERVEKLVEFDGGIWEEVKSFWGKISEQARERNLFRDHADKLRDETNKLFAQLKEFKTKANEALSKVSKEQVASFTERLDGVKTKVDEGMSLSPLFDELKKIQRDFKDAEFTRNDRNKVWKRIDEAFKKVKEKKYGKNPEGQQAGGAVSRVEKRYQGLMSAIGKMEQSINRDKKEIDFQSGRAGAPMGQLEMQLRQAKVMMVQERINSKQEKLDEMLKTKEELIGKVEKEKERAKKREEKQAIEKKKAEVKEKLKAEIKTTDLSPEEAAKLEKAAALINKKPKKEKVAKAEMPADVATTTDSKPDASKTESTVVTEEVKKDTPAKPAQEEKAADATETSQAETSAAKTSVLGAAATVVTEAVEDVVDTAKAVGKVVTDKVEDKVQDLKEGTSHSAEEVAEVSGSTVDKATETLAKGGMFTAAVAMGSKLVKEASEKLDDFSETSGLDKTIDKAKDVLADSKEAISEKTDELKSDVSEVVEEAKEEVAEVKEDIKEEVTEASEEPKKGGLGDTLKKGGLLGAAIALGSKVVDTVSDKVEDVAESLGMDDTLDKAKSKFEEAKELVQDKVDDMKEAVEAKAGVTEESVDSVAERVRAEAKANDASEEE